MNKVLIEIELEKSESLDEITTQSFNNDFEEDEVRNYLHKIYHEIIHSFAFSGNSSKMPSKYRFQNVCHNKYGDIQKLKDKIMVGEYTNEGIIVPKKFSIAFNHLYNCPPLISLIKGDEEYISFLHIWAIRRDSEIVDKQVKHWMQTVTKFGEIKETVFAPRKKYKNEEYDTKYKNAVEDIAKMSQKTIVFSRNINEISGIANEKGVYFNKCGYHLWQK